jgi:hypothetical protein
MGSNALSRPLDQDLVFSVSVLKKRRRLIEYLKCKRSTDLIIHANRKTFKDGQKKVMLGNAFRGSKYRGISKNGNAWQILLMLNQKKKYLGTLPIEE